VHLSYAETLMTTALGPFAGIFEPGEGDAGKFRKARRLAERALPLKADEGSARAAIGTTYLVEADVTPGIEHLRRAYTLLPRRADVALNLYAMLLRTGQRVAADALHAEAFANARDKQLVFAAKNVLLMAETNRANALAKEGKLEEAAAVVRALAAATGDAAGRHDLEQQAAQLEGTANVNKHIRMYNEAVGLANTGKNREAVKLLDQLLAVATDELVVRDAKKLRAEVRKR
jgi:tetratricopeptide (TPR) repeat protein